MNLPKLVAIVGPTASGKTALAQKLAKTFRGEIVSADSRQLYRGMDIGTAKPSKKELKQIKHYLIDVKNPDQNYTLAQYQKDALRAIKPVLKRGKLPFLVGGTGLYVSAVVENWLIPKSRPNKQLRAKLMKDLQKHGLNYLFGKLTTLDPEAAYVVDPKNPRRVIRALEVSLTTKKPFTAQRLKGRPLFEVLLLGRKHSQKKLGKRIEQRIKLMVNQGLLSEVQRLVSKYGFRVKPFDAIGYREVIAYLKGQITLAEAINLITKNTWQFAKRQDTWFKRLPVVWVKSQKQAEQKVKEFLNYQSRQAR